MDYRIHRDKGELESTGYMEIGPSRYSGAHWQEGFLFVWEDAFGMAEGIVAKHFADYDHFAMNDLPAEVARKIIVDWRMAAEGLRAMDPAEAQLVLNLAASYRERLDGEIEAHRSEIRDMLRDLADSCEDFLSHEGWICILGM